MRKLILFFAMFAIVASLQLRAQDNICNPPCTPDPECEDVLNPGEVCPNAADIPVAYTGQFYDETITIIPPASFNLSGTTVAIYKIQIDEVAGLPQGVNWCKSQNEFMVTEPYSRYCCRLYGTPETVGDYRLSLKITPYINVFGTPVAGPQISDDTSLIVRVMPLGLPVANFTSDITVAEVNQDVRFTDLSTNNPTRWQWEFEGTSPPTSSDQNPVVRWTTPGQYGVTLRVQNTAGQDVAFIPEYIRIVDPGIIAASFTSDVTSAVVNQEVRFTDQSINNPTSWSWTFENGIPATSTVQHPIVKWDTPGQYEVSLTISKENQSDTRTIPYYITISENNSITGQDLNESVRIFPNPARENIIVEAERIESISIIDMNGRIIYFEDTNMKNQKIINVNNLPKANYIIKVKTPKVEVVKNISIQ